jgi:hypothetical protein
MPVWKETPNRSKKNTKRQRRNGHPQETTKKTVQWKDAEVKNFNPNAPVIPTYSSSLNWLVHNTQMNNPKNLSPFHPTQLPSVVSTQNTFATPLYLPIHMDHYNLLLQQQ